MTDEETSKRLDRIEKLLQQIVDLMIEDPDDEVEEEVFLEKLKLIDREKFIV